MNQELSSTHKVVGVKQSRKMIQANQAVRVYCGKDADPAIRKPLLELCQAHQVPVVCDYSMEQLGQACQIPVSAAAVTVLKKD